MDYTQVALENKILEMYPEIMGYGLSPRFSFDEDKEAWIIKFRKGQREFTACINQEDADACMDNTYCESLGAELKKILRQVEGKQSARQVNFQEEIAKVAYELFEKSGRAGGRDLENWLEAEQIVITRHMQQAKAEAETFAQKRDFKQATGTSQEKRKVKSIKPKLR